MVVFAKGVTSGYPPLGGALISERVAEPFWQAPGGPIFRHGPTYSGHATCCAAALANLALLEREGLIAPGREFGGELLGAVTPFADHPAVAEVRGGVGLLEQRPDALSRVVMGAREEGVLVRPLGRAVAASPPLTVTTEHLALISQALERGLAAL
ncbi:MAG: aminotransferase class III-fold pyridoxal phosphate-dependent enzyme [Actinomycetota bacterium]|nr:aminotransferase class III-fold pyridoxal phosphate-dependent enzyme [Actinomycetota bacterium]